MHTHLTLYADNIALLSQSWRPGTISRRLSAAITTLYKYFTTWKLRLNNHTTEAILFSKCLPPLPGPNHFQDTYGPWTSTVRYLVLVLDSKILLNRYLHTVSNKATGVFCKIFPIYKLLIRSNLTYAAPLWSSTCSSNYLILQVIQSACLRVIGNHPRRTLTSHPHNSLNIKPITVLIHRLTDKFFAHCPSYTNPPVQQTGNYTLADLTNLYKKYKRKHTKHKRL